MARVGVVAEGPSDALLVEAVLDRFFPGSEVRRVQPETAASSLGTGWRGVRAWCKENGAQLLTFMRGVRGDELDLLVIHADCSMAHNENADRPCPPPADTADGLREVLMSDWLGLSSLPEGVLLMTPSQTTDTWLFAASNHEISDQLQPLECSYGVEAELARLRVYRWKAGAVKKSGQAVAPLVRDAAANWDRVTDLCSEAERFWSDLRDAMEGAA